MVWEDTFGEEREWERLLKVELGEYVGFGWTAPSVRRRDARPGSAPIGSEFISMYVKVRNYSCIFAECWSHSTSFEYYLKPICGILWN